MFALDLEMKVAYFQYYSFDGDLCPTRLGGKPDRKSDCVGGRAERKSWVKSENTPKHHYSI